MEDGDGKEGKFLLFEAFVETIFCRPGSFCAERVDGSLNVTVKSTT